MGHSLRWVRIIKWQPLMKTEEHLCLMTPQTNIDVLLLTMLKVIFLALLTLLHNCVYDMVGTRATPGTFHHFEMGWQEIFYQAIWG